jgi:hypothetical protein
MTLHADYNAAKSAASQASVDTIDGIVDNILADTAVIGSTGQGLTSLATQASVNTVDSVVDAILVDTAVIGALGAGLTAIPWNAAWDAEVQSECADALNAYDPPTKTEMDSGFSGLNDITVADIFAGVVEGAYTLKDAIRLSLAVLTGKSTGGGTSTVNFRDVGDTKNRVTATVDENGNRTSTTIDAGD